MVRTKGEPHIIFMASEMQEVCQKPSIQRPGWQTDTVKGFAESEYNRGLIQITMTCCYCNLLGGMFHVAILILFSKTAQAYEVHWKKSSSAGILLVCIWIAMFIWVRGNSSQKSPTKHSFLLCWKVADNWAITSGWHIQKWTSHEKQI